MFFAKYRAFALGHETSLSLHFRARSRLPALFRQPAAGFRYRAIAARRGGLRMNDLAGRRTRATSHRFGVSAGRVILAQSYRTSTNCSANVGASGRFGPTVFRWVGGIGVAAGFWYIVAVQRAKHGLTCTSLELNIIKQLPTRWCSRAWGALHEVDLPLTLRLALFHAWSAAFGCNLDEMRDPLESYKNLQEFFVRRLKEGARPLAPTPLVSPVDARVLNYGAVANRKIGQVKGITYPMDDLIGVTPCVKTPGRKLYYCTLYLSPGDYHRIHSPVQFTVQFRKHYPGYLFPVPPIVCAFIPGIFALNERVAVLGQWEKGFFSLTAVGAYNVGSIGLEFEEEFKSNVTGAQLGQESVKQYDGGLCVGKGAPFAVFNMGSTVVLVWEDDDDFEFAVEEGEKVRLGQALGRHVGDH